MKKRLVLLQALAILIAVFKYDMREAGQDEGRNSNKFLSNNLYLHLKSRYVKNQVELYQALLPSPIFTTPWAYLSSPHLCNPDLWAMNVQRRSWFWRYRIALEMFWTFASEQKTLIYDVSTTFWQSSSSNVLPDEDCQRVVKAYIKVFCPKSEKTPMLWAINVLCQ